MRKYLWLWTLLVSVGSLAFAQVPSRATAPASALAAKPLTQAVLNDGTPLKLRVGAGITTNSLRVGDELELDVDEEIRVGDVTVVPTSSTAKVVVTSQGLDAARTGKATVSLRYVLLADGEKVALRPTQELKSGAKTVSLTEGEGDVTIGNGEQLTVYINGNLPLDLPKMRLANLPTNELRVVSNPSNAELSVDGKVLGNTPFTGRVVRGEHVLTIRMAGFQPWRQTVAVGAEPASLQIALKKQDGLETLPPPAAAAPASLGDLARAARAKKPSQDPQKPSTDPIELLPGENRQTTTPTTTPAPAPQN
jgi:hypothetical protein